MGAAGVEAGILRFTTQLGEAQGAIATPTGLTYLNHGKSYLNQQYQGNINSEVAQSCLTLRDPMDCSLPGSSVHEIFQARVLEWGAIAFFVRHGSY